MLLKTKLFLLVLISILLIFVIRFVVKKKLRIELSILWLAICFVIIMMVFWQNLADDVAYYIGIYYPPALFFAVALLFVFIMMFHFAVEISILKENNKILIQEISIYKHIINDLKNHLPAKKQKRKL